MNQITNRPSSWVLASSNQGKLKEFARLFSTINLPYDLVSQAEFGVEDAIEDGLSFVENALIKARHASKQTGLPAIADDSGLCVPLLNGAPGIYSARYAGQHGDDPANNQKLLADLADYRNDHSTIDAYFVCVLVMVRHSTDPLPIIAQGLWHGRILAAQQGQAGFGYDPLFWVESCQSSAAEMTAEQKNKMSHRAQALQDFIQQIKNDSSLV